MCAWGKWIRAFDGDVNGIQNGFLAIEISDLYSAIIESDPFAVDL